MNADNKSPGLVAAARRRARRLRIVAVAVLLLGIFGADAVYWLGTRSANESDNPLGAGYNKAQARQAEILYGKQALLFDEWSQELKHPGTQACVLFVAAALAAAGCFYFAHLLEPDDEPADETPRPHG